MALPSIKNSVGMAVSAVADSGVGTITLGAALSGGYQTAATAYGANANIDIRIEEGNTWEVCRDCTYTHSGTTVTRGTQEEGSSGPSTRVAFTSAAKVYVVESAERIQDRLIANITVIPYGATQALSASTSTTLTTALNATPTIDVLGIWDGTNKKLVFNRLGIYFLILSMQVDTVTGDKFILPGFSVTGATLLSNNSVRAFVPVSSDANSVSSAFIKVTAASGQEAVATCYLSDSGNRNTDTANLSVIWLGY